MPVAHDRARILRSVGLCFSETCTAHDRIVEAILGLEASAYKQGVESGFHSGFQAGIEAERGIMDG